LCKITRIGVRLLSNKTWKVPRPTWSAVTGNEQLAGSPGAMTKWSVKVNRPVLARGSAAAGPAATSVEAAATIAVEQIAIQRTAAILKFGGG
jgi:hypothetical protein